MTIKIELSDTVLVAAERAHFESELGLRYGSGSDGWRAAISAAFEAMVEEGTATIVECTDVDDKVRPTLIIRLDGGKS